MSDERFIDIEMKLEHQDQALIELNAALTKQQETIMTLERQFASMLERISRMDDVAPEVGPGNEQPPHY